MLFPEPQANATAYLILRHLYDGDVIEWPIADDHPERDVFAGLEAQGYVARWDRVWPLHDRYRLTEKGIAAIESVYRPSGAEAFMGDLRARNLNPAERRGFLLQRGLDALLWPVLHDPSTHWSTYRTSGSRYAQYLWEDQRPKPRRADKRRNVGAKAAGGGGGARVHHVVHHHHVRHHHHPHTVDLDRDAHDPVAPLTPDYDVS